jgi:hypothetical protein
MSKKVNKYIDLTGEIFGFLSVVGPSGKKDNSRSKQWFCQCLRCGNLCIVSAQSLKSSRTSSCGCLGKERRIKANTRHNQSSKKHRTLSYKTWDCMMQRCYNENRQSYKDYGGRGIKVCNRWHNFENFYYDMGERPCNMTIDRINPDGDYEPNNCRWASNLEQSHNKRSRGFSWNKKNKKYVAYITVNGKRKHLGYYSNPVDAKNAYVSAKPF